jgi:hypothetical protein
MNPTALVAGVVLMALGFAVLLDEAGEINLEFAYTGPALLAAVGLILLVSGLTSRWRARG